MCEDVLIPSPDAELAVISDLDDTVIETHSTDAGTASAQSCTRSGCQVGPCVEANILVDPGLTGCPQWGFSGVAQRKTDAWGGYYAEFSSGYGVLAQNRSLTWGVPLPSLIMSSSRTHSRPTGSRSISSSTMPTPANSSHGWKASPAMLGTLAGTAEM